MSEPKVLDCEYPDMKPHSDGVHHMGCLRPATQSELIAALLPGNSPGARDAVEMMVQALTKAGIDGLDPFLPEVSDE